MKVFILLVLAVNHPFIGPIVVDGDAPVYKNAAACLRAAPKVQEAVTKKFDQVYVECREKILHEDK